MKENNLKMVLVLLLTIIALALVVFMILLLQGKFTSFSFFHTKGETKVILEEIYNTENIKKIKVDASISDIKIIESTDNNIKVIIYGEEENTAKSLVEGTVLSISNNRKNRICFGFCFFAKEEVLVYLPKKVINELDLKSISGDISVADYETVNITAKTTSGDIHLNSAQNGELTSTSGDIQIGYVKNISAQTVSGEITIEKLEEKGEISTTSGDIRINEFVCQKDSHIKSISGDVVINSLTDAFVDAKSTSGDINLDGSNRYSQNTLTIKTTSGDIRVK